MDLQTTTQDKDSTEETARYWLARLEAEETQRSDWMSNVKDVRKKYRSKQDDNKSRDDKNANAQFNVLWSNIETMRPALFSRLPKPYCERKSQERDDVSRVACRLLEAAIVNQLQACDTKNILKGSINDYLLAGVGTAWPSYDASFAPVYGEDGVTPSMGEDGQPLERVASEKIYLEFIRAEDFFWDSEGYTWGQCQWVAKRVMLTRKEAEQKFGKDVVSQILKDMGKSALEKQHNKLCVFEVWDKVSQKVYWISKDSDKRILREDTPPLKLQEFFPCPRPLMGTLANDNLIPTLDFTQYKAQAGMLDKCSAKMQIMLNAMKTVGVYDAAMGKDLQNLLNRTDASLVPVQNWPMHAEKGGLKGAVDWLDISQYVAALQALYQIRGQIKQDIYELTGISDILRGQGNPNETATAQKIKGNFATMRLQERQDEVQRFMRDLVRIYAEIISEHFQPETIVEMANIPQSDGDFQYIPAALELLKNDRLRTFRIDIETDSTIQVDKDAEKQRRMEMLSAIIPNLEKAMAMVTQAPESAPLLGQLVLYALRSFSVGRELESEFEQAIENMREQSPAQPEQNGDAIKSQGEMQIKQIEMSHEMQLKQMEFKHEEAMELMKFEHAVTIEEMKHAGRQAPPMLQESFGGVFPPT